MLETQKKFLNYLQEVKNEVDKIEFSEEIKKNFDFQELITAVNDRELLIPVVGAFSAGKSSLLNSFLTKDYLPVGITPETALATELRYSDKESQRIEAVKKDGSFEKYPVSDTEEIKKRASTFKYIKMYLDNENLKKIAPLILVDMPGFDSPWDLHQQAIIEYINRGVHYIVLTSVEDGTITRSMIRQLENIQDFERDFSFFLSKANLKSESDIKEIAEEIKKRIKDDFDIAKEVIPVDDNGIESLQKVLKKIDPENLFKTLFIPPLRANFNTVINNINISISALEKNQVESEEVINEIKKGMEYLIKKRDLMLEEAREKYSDIRVDSIIDKLGRKLSDSVEELVTAATSGGKEAMSKTMMEIMRHSLIGSIKESVDEMSSDIIEKFSDNLSNLNDPMSKFSFSENWLNKITQNVKSSFDLAQKGWDNILGQRQSKKNPTKMYQAVTSVLAITTKVLNPILEIIIVFLPSILSALFEKFQENQKKEQIRNVILTQVIPQVKREVRSEISDLLAKEAQQMISNISNRFEQEIQEKQKIIEETIQDKKAKIADIEKTVAERKNVRDKISNLANNILYAQS